MPITKLPGVYYDENVTYELTGEGSKIPVIIGATDNAPAPGSTYKADGTQIRKYTSWEEVNKPITAENPGIGVWSEGTSNKLSQFLYEFFKEARLLTNADSDVPFIYVIDVGDGTTKKAWVDALTLAKSKSDAQIEVYVGADNIDSYNLPAFLKGAYAAILEETHDLDLRCAFTTKYGATDEQYGETDKQLIALTNESSGIQKSRIGICEPLLFGKTVARICCTPSNMEPGHLVYRSVEPGTFIDRTKAEMLKLQNAGIIFNRDEHINGNIYPKMNLCVATSFAATTRPADALFHARFNADSLLREVFEACYSQIKANESASNLAYLQTRINKIVNDKVSAEEMVEYDERTEAGTKLIATESDNDPYIIIITGQIQPVKCTIAIEVEATVKL